MSVEKIQKPKIRHNPVIRAQTKEEPRGRVTPVFKDAMRTNWNSLRDFYEACDIDGTIAMFLIGQQYPGQSFDHLRSDQLGDLIYELDNRITTNNADHLHQETHPMIREITQKNALDYMLEPDREWLHNHATENWVYYSIANGFIGIMNEEPVNTSEPFPVDINNVFIYRYEYVRED